MIVLVTGGRDFDDELRIYGSLDRVQLESSSPIVKVFVGDARGADLFARRWCVLRGVPHERFGAFWEQEGRAAGHLRNDRMVRAFVAIPHETKLCVAAPGGRGTADCVRRAKAAGLRVVDIDGKDVP